MRSLSSIIDRVSPSKLELFERCPAAFAHRYVEGIRSPPGVANALGNAVDATANGVYFAKFQTRETTPKRDVLERFTDWWSREASKVPDLTPTKRGELLDVGVRSMGHWREAIAQKVQPVREPQVVVELPHTDPDAAACAALGISPSFTINGVFDLVAEVPAPAGGLERAAIDHKASGKAWHLSDVMRSAQAPIYTRGTAVPVFQFHVLRTDLVNPRTSVIRQVVPATAVDHVFHRIVLARRMIARCYQSGDWAPHRNHMLCSRRWCGFWQSCERRHGGVVPA